MNQSGKLVLGLLALGGIGAMVFMSGEANAAPGGAPSPTPNPGPNPLGLPPIPSNVQLPALPDLNTAGASLPGVVPPAGTQIPLPGGGSIAVPAIPGLNTGNTSPVVLAPAPAPQPSAPAPALTLPPLPVSLPPITALPGLIITPGPAPAPGAPPASPAEVASTAPADTLQVVSQMLQQEASPHWRIMPNALLKAWQKARNRPVDGNFGTGDALALAQEIGTIPIIRAWPKGSFPGDGKLDNYRASLQQIANSKSEPQASQLRQSAARELGQGYGTPEKPIAHLITIQSV